ncbi:MAG TPA: ROK family protein [Beijerinckiaceae bacterium]|jgi:predicted NBD/HSP70 family sugar kinase
MAEDKGRGEPRHGASELPAVTLDSFNLELRAKEGFLGDRASKKAFWRIVEDWRDRMRDADEDPFGDTPTDDITKKQLDDVLSKGSGEAAGVVLGAVEEFATELASVIRRFLKEKGWEKTERIVVGGGMRGGRIGELAIGRAGVLLKTDGARVDLEPVRQAPDDAGLIGAAHLTPRWTLKGYDALLAVDIGGTNIRAGVVTLNTGKRSDFSRAEVWKSKIWRHADDEPSRTAAVEKLVKMLRGLIDQALDSKLALAPFIGVGCPGVIAPDGSIERGGQNLPGGNWESERFNLPALLYKAIPEIDDEETHIVMHNDAVVQGLSQIPFMTDVSRWGVVTIGTGLGNARFTNRAKGDRS